MPHSERPKIPKRRVLWCAECHRRILSDLAICGEQTFHQECLSRAAPKFNIYRRLVEMGLDQPPAA